MPARRATAETDGQARPADRPAPPAPHAPPAHVAAEGPAPGPMAGPEAPLFIEATPRKKLRVLPPVNRRTKDIQAFYGISRLGSVALEPQEAGRQALGAICRALGFSRAEVWLAQEGRRTVTRFCARGYDVQVDAPEVHFMGHPFTRRLVKRTQGIFHPDVEARGGDGHPAWPGLTSLFGAPIRARGRLIGFLYADRGGERFGMTASELELATALSSLAGEVIVGALNRKAEARRHRHVLLLNRVSRLIGVEDRLQVLLPRLARIIKTGTGSLGITVRIYDEAVRGLRLVAAAGPGAKSLIGLICPTRRGRGSLTPGVLVFQKGRPLLVNPPRPLPETLSYWPGICSALLVPIRVKERAIGVLRLEATRRFTFTDADVKVCTILAEQIGHAVERSSALEALRRKRDDLRALSVCLDQRVESERQRIAQILHDGIGQSMTAARIKLGVVEGVAPPRPATFRKELQEVAGMIDGAIEEIRRISMDLRPAMLDELGLLPAARWYAAGFQKRTGIRATVRAREAEPRAGREQETLLFRFLQDAMADAERRGRVREVRVDLGRQAGVMRVEVWDNGLPLPNESSQGPSLALLGMRERIEWAGGTFRADSQPGHGNRLIAEMPLPAEEIGGGTGGLG